ncbi:MAG: hypothetical protein ACI9WU_001987 [Myxococcota bacterium]
MRLRLLCLASAVISLGCTVESDPIGPGDDSECAVGLPLRPAVVPVAPGPIAESKTLYAEDALHDVRLEISAKAWDQLLQFYEQKRKSVVPVHLTFDQERFENAGFRLKGTADRWRTGRKMQFVIRFDYYTGGRFRGVRRLNLDHEGVAPIRNNTGMALMRGAGLIAPRTNWIRLWIDTPDAPADAADGAYPQGYYGIYESIEVVDDVFLDGRFADPGGALYKGAERQTEGNTDLGGCDLDQLLLLVDEEPLEGGHEAFFARLAQTADVDQLLRLLAAEAVVALGDNFWAGGNNFYLYNDPLAGWVGIPWDVDDVLSEVSPSEAGLFDFAGVVRVGALPNRLWQLVQQRPEWRQAFVDEVQRIRTTLFPELRERIPQWCAMLREDVRMDITRRFTMEEYDHDCLAMISRLDERDAWLGAISADGVVAP